MCKAIKEKLKDDQFSLNPFTEKEVINFISKLPTNKPSVPKDTLVFIPKQSIHVYCTKLANIMNGCLNYKIFLDNIENTQITPCYKKKNKGNKENYRPVNILSNFGKVFERLIHRQFRSSEEPKFSIFLPGFRKKHNMLYFWSL